MAQVLPYPLRSLCVTNHLFHFDSYESEWSEEHFLLCLRDFLQDWQTYTLSLNASPYKSNQ